MPHRHSALLLALTVACAAAPRGPSADPEPLREAARVEVVRTLSTPPEGGDGASLLELRVTSAQGDEHVFAPFVGGVPFGDAALLLDGERALSLGRGTGERTPLDTDVAFVPVVAPEGDSYVYATSEDGSRFALVRVTDDGTRVTLAEGLASIGAVHFVDEARFVFAGGRSGGVAGLWMASAREPSLAICLTNCALHTGQPWGDAFVPLPADLERVSLDADVVSYVDAAGVARRVPLEGSAR
jgi:hypothetical protein